MLWMLQHSPDLDEKSYRMNLSERKNQVLSNVSSFFGIVTVPKSCRQGGLPKPLAALWMMGIVTKLFLSMRAAGMGLTALSVVVRPHAPQLDYQLDRAE